MLVRNITSSNTLKTIKYEDGSIYQGNTMMDKENLMRHGYGKFFDKTKTYHGEFTNNLKEGSGKEYTNHYSYSGEFKENKFHGNGIYENKDTHIIFTGPFFNGLRHGDGIEVHKRTNISYEVTYNMGISNSIIPFFEIYKNGKVRIAANKYKNTIIGPCKMYFDTGQTLYKGSYKNGFKKGELNYFGFKLNGVFYKKESLKSNYEEAGIYEFSGLIEMKFNYFSKFITPYNYFLLQSINTNDSIYLDGKLKITLKYNDDEDDNMIILEIQLINIEAKLINSKNNLIIKFEELVDTRNIDIDYSYKCCHVPSTYKVSIRNNLVTGTHSHENIYKGSLNNKMQYNGEGKLYRINGGLETLMYEGEFKNNIYHGHGTNWIIGNDGSILKQYEGNWLNNYHSGQGIEYYLNGQIKYEGTFLDHIPSGEGTLYDDGGNIIFSGSFEEGAPQLV